MVQLQVTLPVVCVDSSNQSCMDCFCGVVKVCGLFVVWYMSQSWVDCVIQCSSKSKLNTCYPALFFQLYQNRLCHEKGNTQFFAYLSTESVPSLMRAVFLDLSFSTTSVHSCLSELCVQGCFKCSLNLGLEISWVLHTAQVSLRRAFAFGKHAWKIK